MQWEERFRLKVDAMDHEHQKLISLMNDLYDSAQTADRVRQKRELDALADYTRQHFASEEQFMESVQFAGIDLHRRQHKQLLETFGTHIARFEAGEALGDKFFQFLRFWLSAHICGIDTKYAQHVSAA